MGAVLEQEQARDGRILRMIKSGIGHASKTLNASQQCYCTINKELLTVVTAMELFKCYWTGRHFMVVTYHAKPYLAQNFKEPEGVVAQWITWLQPFAFDIVHIRSILVAMQMGTSCLSSLQARYLP